MKTRSAVSGPVAFQCIFPDNGDLMDSRAGLAGAVAAKHLAATQFETASIFGTDVQVPYRIASLAQCLADNSDNASTGLTKTASHYRISTTFRSRNSNLTTFSPAPMITTAPIQVDMSGKSPKTTQPRITADTISRY